MCVFPNVLCKYVCVTWKREREREREREKEGERERERERERKRERERENRCDVLRVVLQVVIELQLVL